MKNYKKNLALLTKNHVYSKEMEHDSCGVGLISSTEGKKSRAVVEYGIEALKAIWHRGAVDADGKSGDGAVNMLGITTLPNNIMLSRSLFSWAVGMFGIFNLSF